MKNQIVETSKHFNRNVEVRAVQQSVEAPPLQRYIGGLLAKVDQAVATSGKWGWLPEIALLKALGLLVVAWAFVGARAATSWAEPLFWLGLATLIVPVAVRLASSEVSRRERITLVVLLGMAFYLVKVMHSPFAFTFPDELSNFRNVREVLQTHRLFQENPELPVLALYPGLPTVTSTLVSLSGLSIFPAGILVVGAARLVLFLALYLLYEQISASAQVASFATLLYMANSNFLFWTAEYSYESLALPLAILVLYAVARREMTGDHRFALTAVALLGIMTVVISHHMTSYVLTALLWAITIFSVVRSRGKQRGPWDLALVALLATSFWLLFIARLTINYLSPVLGGAVRSILRLSVGEGKSRQLFASGSGYVSPLWEQLTVLGSVTLITIGLPFGWFEIWQRHRNNALALVLAAVALFYPPMQLFRFTSRGWETANRSSEFLFIGIAFVLALSIVKFWLARWSGWVSNTVLSGFVVILFFGGFIAGWPPQARLPRPYIVAAGSRLVEPESVVMAKWTFDFLGPDNRIAADKVNAKLLNGYGEQAPFTGGAHGIKDMFFSDNVGRGERNIIRQTGIQYIVSERRLISWDHMIGLYFLNQESSPSWELELIDSETYEKFEGLERVNRIFDSGNIAIYDVGVYLETPIE